MSVSKVGTNSPIPNGRSTKGQPSRRGSKKASGVPPAPSLLHMDLVRLEKRDKTHAALKEIKDKVKKAGLYKGKTEDIELLKKFSLPVTGNYRVNGETVVQEGEQEPPLHYLNLACAFLEECLRVKVPVKDAFKLLIEKKTELSPTEAFLLACNLDEYTSDIDDDEDINSKGKSETTEAIALIICALNISKSDVKEKLAPFLIPYDKKDDDYEDCLELAFRAYKKNINDAFKTGIFTS